MLTEPVILKKLCTFEWQAHIVSVGFFSCHVYISRMVFVPITFIELSHMKDEGCLLNLSWFGSFQIDKKKGRVSRKKGSNRELKELKKAN